MNLDYYIVKKNDKVGIINSEPLTRFRFNYQDLSPCYYNPENRFIAKKNNKFGVIGLRGNIIIPFIYDELSNWVEYGPGSNYHFVSKNNKKGLITKDGKIIIPPIYDELLYKNNQTIIFSKDYKFGVLTLQNTPVIPFDYDKICQKFLIKYGGQRILCSEERKYFHNKQ